MHRAKNIRALRGSNLVCKDWPQEAAMRMLMNNLDPDVAENPDQLIVYGGRGKAARNFEDYEEIINQLKKLSSDETLLIQSGKAVGVINTHEEAPRVLLANSNLVGKWATWEKFDELERKGLIMFGQMTAGSWIYIGSQGIVQGTYETFAEAARKHFNANSLAGKIVLSSGLGGMGGAQPLAITMLGGVGLIIEVDEHRAKKRLATKYLDTYTHSLEQALKLCEEHKQAQSAYSIGLIGNAAEIFPQLVARNFTPDLVTDQTSAHDPLYGYVPKNMTLAEVIVERERNPDMVIKRARESMAEQLSCMLHYHDAGIPVFDYGNNIRAEAEQGGCSRAFTIEGFVPLYIRPLFCEGMGPFRVVALSGNSVDIARIDQALITMFDYKPSLKRWISLAAEKIAFQGLPARICWLGYGERDKAALKINSMVRSGELSAPIVIGRDHLDAGSVASPNRETESMLDGSDAIADWPILNALINSACGATWVSFHHGGGVGMGYSLHAGQVCVADGSEKAQKMLARVMRADPALGIMRHADAGYEKAKLIATKRGVKIPHVTC